MQAGVHDPFCRSEAAAMADVSVPVQHQSWFCSLTNAMGRQRSLKLFWRLCNDAWEPTCFCLSAFLAHISQDATGRGIQPNWTALVIGLLRMPCGWGGCLSDKQSNQLCTCVPSGNRSLRKYTTAREASFGGFFEGNCTEEIRECEFAWGNKISLFLFVVNSFSRGDFTPECNLRTRRTIALPAPHIRMVPARQNDCCDKEPWATPDTWAR